MNGSTKTNINIFVTDGSHPLSDCQFMITDVAGNEVYDWTDLPAGGGTAVAQISTSTDLYVIYVRGPEESRLPDIKNIATNDLFRADVEINFHIVVRPDRGLCQSCTTVTHAVPAGCQVVTHDLCGVETTVKVVDSAGNFVPGCQVCAGFHASSKLEDWRDVAAGSGEDMTLRWSRQTLYVEARWTLNHQIAGNWNGKLVRGRHNTVNIMVDPAP